MAGLKFTSHGSGTSSFMFGSASLAFAIPAPPAGAIADAGTSTFTISASGEHSVVGRALRLPGIPWRTVGKVSFVVVQVLASVGYLLEKLAPLLRR